MREYKLYLLDIVEAMESVERFVEGMTFEEFQRDDTSQRKSNDNIPMYLGKRCQV